VSLTKKQFETLRRPLNSSRIAKRSQGGKQLSYLESWEVRAHLIRVFGYGNFDIEVRDTLPLEVREYKSENDKPMAEAVWFAKVRLTVRDIAGDRICRYTESAVGSSSAPASMLAESHDNAVKTAASDALKRCAINLGTQFGLSLYDQGTTADVVKNTIAPPPGVEPDTEALSPEQAENLRNTLGAETVDETPTAAPPAASEEVSA